MNTLITITATALAVGGAALLILRRVERLHAETQAALAQAGVRIESIGSHAQRTNRSLDGLGDFLGNLGRDARRARSAAELVAMRTASGIEQLQPAPAHVADPAEVPELPDDLEDPIGLLRTLQVWGELDAGELAAILGRQVPEVLEHLEGAIEGGLVEAESPAASGRSMFRLQASSEAKEINTEAVAAGD